MGTYFIEAINTGTIKIGKSDNVTKRLSALQMSSFTPLKVLGFFPDGVISEYEAHKKFSHLRIRGEWFKAEKELRNYIRELKEKHKQIVDGEELRKPVESFMKLQAAIKIDENDKTVQQSNQNSNLQLEHLLTQLYEKNTLTFTVIDALKILQKDIRSTVEIIDLLEKKKVITKIKNGIYQLIPLESGKVITRNSNPFKPTFGASPPFLGGRDESIEEFKESLENGPGSPGRATIYTGPRGVGKTAMLNKTQEIAKKLGWFVISETASQGFINRLSNEYFPALLSEFDSGVKDAIMATPMKWGGATLKNKAPMQAGLRTQMTELCRVMEANQTGILISLDKINYQQIDELREFFTSLQHLFREEHEIAFVGGGSLEAIHDVLNDSSLGFLERADRYVLEPLSLEMTMEAIAKPIESGGRKITPEVCKKAAQATGGYPLLIQLVGYQSWNVNPNEPTITLADVEKGVVKASRKMGTLFYEPILSSVSDVGRIFLSTMAQDKGPSNVSDISIRLKVDKKYIST